MAVSMVVMVQVSSTPAWRSHLSLWVRVMTWPWVSDPPNLSTACTSQHLYYRHPPGEHVELLLQRRLHQVAAPPPPAPAPQAAGAGRVQRVPGAGYGEEDCWLLTLRTWAR